jgi:hypothetical protein
MKKLKDWWRMRKRIGMSELGFELLDAMEGDDKWVLSTYEVTHKASGIALWISNGRSHFRLRTVPNTSFDEEKLKTALNKRDLDVLWEAYQQMLINDKKAPADITLNILRLGRIKAQGEMQ